MNIVKKGRNVVGLHIVLYQPEIPTNTGNIARTCLGTNTTLHLIHPLGFSTDDKMVKRAGLDYWEHVHIEEHLSIDAFYEQYPEAVCYYIENFGTTYYTECDYSDSEQEIFFIFGKETTGIPKELIKGKEKNCLRVPMTAHIRSLNLANTASIIIYEALRQQAFNQLT